MVAACFLRPCQRAEVGREDQSMDAGAAVETTERAVVLRLRQALRLSYKPKIFPLDAAVDECSLSESTPQRDTAGGPRGESPDILRLRGDPGSTDAEP
jgi:hypothetical protein